MVEAEGFNGGAFWLEGDTSTGKTSLGYILGRMFRADVHVLNANRCNDRMVREIEDSVQHSPLFGVMGWHVWIIDEAHAMKPAAIQEWLTLLENLPAQTLIVFTTTQPMFVNRGKGDGLWNEFTHPFASRCFYWKLTNQGLRRPFAERLKSVMQAEGKDGKPIEHYEKVIKDCNGNMREALMRAQQGRI